MFVYSEDTVKRKLSDWGREVKKRLIDNGMAQDAIVSRLNEQGFKIDKTHFSNLLYGIGSSNRGAEIAAVNKMLDIPSV